MLVSQILKDKANQGVLTVTKDTSVADASAILSREKVGAVIVSEDGVHPQGIVSERDIVRELGARGTGCLTDPVSAIMTEKLIGCVPGDRAIAVLQKMTEGRFRHMPVMQEGQLVGLISIGDVVNYRLTALEYEALQLKQLIVG